MSMGSIARLAGLRTSLMMGQPLVLAVTVIICLGVYLRTLGMFDLQFWVDEALWAMYLHDGEYFSLRPPGYMWVSQLVASIIPGEPGLRLLSWLAGMLVLPLVYLVFRKILASPWLAVLGLLIIAVHPAAISMSKEFKPYALELFMHVLLVYLVLVYKSRGSARALTGLLAVVVPAPLFSWSVVFLYPGLFLVLWYEAWRYGRLQQLVIIVASAVAVLTLLGALYFFHINVGAGVDPGYWSWKYDVFMYESSNPLGWLVAKTAEVAAFPVRLVWYAPVESVAVIVSSVLCGLAVVLMGIRREGQLLALLVLPWYVVLVFNLAGLWPYGMFRTNLFLLFYAVALAVYALDIVWQSTGSRFRAMRFPAVLALWAVFVLMIPLNLDAYRNKDAGGLTRTSHVHTAMQALFRQVGERSPEQRLTLILDGHACWVFEYYLNYHKPEATPPYRQWYTDKVDIHCKGFNPESYLTSLDDHAGENFWIIVGKPPLIAPTVEKLEESCDFRNRTVYAGVTLLGECVRS